MSQSGLNNYQDECLLILMEECGETIQEICKIKRFGINEMSMHKEDQSHAQRLEEELGDLLAMIQLVMESDIGITEIGLDVAKQKKLAKVGKWMTYSKLESNFDSGTHEVMRKSLELAQRQLNSFKVRKD
jgi:NTP pyrophosphatase (non-canonical NTP hydrolase)